MRDRDKILIISLALFVSLGLSSSAEANLLVNPGFETGDFTGWELEYSNPDTRVSIINEHSGAYHARLIDVTSMTQRVSVIPGNAYYLTAWVFVSEGLATDEYGAYLVLDFLNDSDKSIGGWYELVHRLDRMQYHEIESGWITAPDEAVAVAVKGQMIGGEPMYMDLDDFNLQVVPEPVSIILLGLGLFGLRFVKKNKERVF